MNGQYQHSHGIILLSAIARMQTPWSVWLKFETGNSMARDRYDSISNIIIMFYFILIVIILQGMTLKKRPVVKFRDMSSTIASRCATSNGSGLQVDEVDSDFAEDDDDDKQPEERSRSGAEYDVQLEDCDYNNDNDDNDEMTDIISGRADVFRVEDTVNLLNPGLLDILADSDTMRVTNKTPMLSIQQETEVQRTLTEQDWEM